MNIIPTNRPGNDCHLHLIGKSFAQRVIPLLSPSDEAIPICLQNINHQNIPDIEINKQNEETTIQTTEKNIQFNTETWPLEYTSCLSLKYLTKFLCGNPDEKQYLHKLLETGGGNNIIQDPPSVGNDPVQAHNLPPTADTTWPSDHQNKIHKLEYNHLWVSNLPWTNGPLRAHHHQNHVIVIQKPQ
jgi:hypothetical protein